MSQKQSAVYWLQDQNEKSEQLSSEETYFSPGGAHLEPGSENSIRELSEMWPRLMKWFRRWNVI